MKEQIFLTLNTFCIGYLFAAIYLLNKKINNQEKIIEESITREAVVGLIKVRASFYDQFKELTDRIETLESQQRAQETLITPVAQAKKTKREKNAK